MSANVTDAELAHDFIRGLERAEEIYRRLIGLTQNQSEIIRHGVSPRLLELAEAKESELARLTELEELLGPARTGWVGIRERISGDLRGRVQEVVRRVETVLRELLVLEEEEGKSLAARRDETVAQIRRLDSARKVRGAYAAPPAQPSLLDQRE